MGQQQLLLIVLSIIIVGIAVVIGLGLFSEGADQANIDQVVQDVISMGSKAQQYYMKPTALGGGGQDFSAIAITDIGSATNANGERDGASTPSASPMNISGVQSASGKAITRARGFVLGCRSRPSP